MAVPVAAPTIKSEAEMAEAIAEAITGNLRPFAPFEEQLPRRFGPFELQRLIGRGGMAQVYEAHRIGALGLHTRAAVKILHENLTSDDRFLRPFVREAELTGQISHPNILQIHEFNRVGDRFFIAMEQVEGCDLGRLLHSVATSGERLPQRVVVDILCQVLRGLGWAHRARNREGKPLELIHRDLKPANILIGRTGQVKVADFGIAQSSASMYVTATAKDLKGTLMYMSPEQIRQLPLTQVSDLYSVGMILFEMLSGEPLITKGSLKEVVRSILKMDLDACFERLPSDAAHFLPVLRAALEPEPIWRYGSALEMADDLHGLRALLPDSPSLERYVETICREIELDDVDYDSRPTPVQTDQLQAFTPEDLQNFQAPPTALRIIP